MILRVRVLMFRQYATRVGNTYKPIANELRFVHMLVRTRSVSLTIKPPAKVIEQKAFPPVENVFKSRCDRHLPEGLPSPVSVAAATAHDLGGGIVVRFPGPSMRALRASGLTFAVHTPCTAAGIVHTRAFSTSSKRSSNPPSAGFTAPAAQVKAADDGQTHSAAITAASGPAVASPYQVSSEPTGTSTVTQPQVSAPIRPSSGIGSPPVNQQAGDSKGGAWWQSSLSAVIAAIGGVIATSLVFWLTSGEEKHLATVAVGFEQRRFEAIKERVLKPVQPKRKPSNDELVVATIERGQVLRLLENGSTEPTVIIAPKGDGKTTAMCEWARVNPHLIYVDVSQENSYAEGVKAVADAIGYATSYSDDEGRAQGKGHKLPDLDAMGEIELKKILALYRRACSELVAEGKLHARAVPTLVLDHSTRPLTVDGRRDKEKLRDNTVDDLDQPPKERRSTLTDTLIRVFLDAAKGETSCRFCIVTSDVYAEDRVIKSAEPWDEIVYERLPPFTPEEAETLLVYGIHARLAPKQAGAASTLEHTAPTPEQAEEIRRQYGRTISFLLEAVGCRPRRLLKCLKKATLMTDAELDAARPVLSESLKALLPAKLHDRLVEPGVAATLHTELVHFRKAINAMLAVPSSLVLPPSTDPPPTPNAQQLVQRVLLVDRWLRALTEGPQDSGDVENAFSGRKDVLDRLLSFHVLFLDHSTDTIAYESDAVRDIALNILNSTAHKNRMQLARKLLEWQKAVKELSAARSAEDSAKQAALTAQELQNPSYNTWFGWLKGNESAETGRTAAIAANTAAAARRNAAEVKVSNLETSIEQLREQVTGDFSAQAAGKHVTGDASAAPMSPAGPAQPATGPVATASPA